MLILPYVNLRLSQDHFCLSQDNNTISGNTPAGGYFNNWYLSRRFQPPKRRVVGKIRQHEGSPQDPILYHCWSLLYIIAERTASSLDPGREPADFKYIIKDDLGNWCVEGRECCFVVSWMITSLVFLQCKKLQKTTFSQCTSYCLNMHLYAVGVK